MLTKEETIQAVLKAYKENNGCLTFAILFKQSITRSDSSKVFLMQHDIKRHFGGKLDILHKELGLERKKKRTRIDYCKRCNKKLIVYKSSLKDFEKQYCFDCKIAIHNEKFTGIKDYDYVECPECCYKALSLEGHFRKINTGTNFSDNIEIYPCSANWQYCKLSQEQVKQKYGDFKIKCINSDLKTKNTRRQYGYFKNREETLKKMSDSAGKHIKGKTKENCEFIKRLSETKKRRFIEKLIPKEAFNQFKDENGKLKIKDALKGLKISLRQLFSYLDRYNLKNDYTFIKKTSKFQLLILDKISKLLNDDNYETELSFKKLKINEKNSYLRYDGYFYDKILLVETHGYQHYVFPNRYHKTLEQFHKQQENDRIKKQAAIDNNIKFLEVSCYDSLDDIKNKLQALNLV